MGIFDLFKKLFKEEDLVKSKSEQSLGEKIPFSEIENWLENKVKENEIKEKEILFVIKGKIKDFIKELKGKITILERFDVGAKKEEERIKNIVIDGREKYIRFVGELIERLNNLKETKLEKVIWKINKIFFDFNKSSFNNYERATILIGKEMASVKESMKDFSKDLLKFFDNNKFIVDSFKSLLIIKEKLNTIISIDKTLEKIDENKSNLNKEIIKKEEEGRILKEKIEEIKKSQNYLDFLDSQKIMGSLKLELKENILELKQLLDFKALANFFHIFKEQMNIVKIYKEDFYTHFIKDNGKSLMSLLDEAKLSNDMILEKVNLIRIKIEKAASYEKNLEEDEIKKVHFKIKEVELEVDNLRSERVKEKKREEKLRTKRGELRKILEGEIGREVVW